jgi:hypothetical protein
LAEVGWLTSRKFSPYFLHICAVFCFVLSYKDFLRFILHCTFKQHYRTNTVTLIKLKIKYNKTTHELMIDLKTPTWWIRLQYVNGFPKLHKIENKIQYEIMIELQTRMQYVNGLPIPVQKVPSAAKKRQAWPISSMVPIRPISWASSPASITFRCSRVWS